MMNGLRKYFEWNTFAFNCFLHLTEIAKTANKKEQKKKTEKKRFAKMKNGFLLHL